VTGNKRNVEKPSPLFLCGRELPFVKQAAHLGNIIIDQGHMEQDAATKRASFIQSSVQIREQFKFAAPAEILKAMKVYTNSFYGSNLWDLNGEKANQLYTAWNTSVKMVWGCPIQTRSFFLQDTLCCGYTSAKTDILTRYPRFFQSLLNSPGRELRVISRLVSRDIRSTTGKNLTLLQDLTGLNPWKARATQLREKLALSEFVKVPEIDKWRIPYFRKLFSLKATTEDEATAEHISELIRSLVIN